MHSLSSIENMHAFFYPCQFFFFNSVFVSLVFFYDDDKDDENDTDEHWAWVVALARGVAPVMFELDVVRGGAGIDRGRENREG